FRRITSAPTHDDFMQNKADPLTKTQIDLIKDWINQGAVWPEEAVAKVEVSPSPLARLVDIKPGATETKAIEKLASLGMAVRPIAMNLNWKEANLGLQGTNVTDATLAVVKDVPTLVDLNLAGT